MIRARCTTGEFILGIDANNVRKLKEGDAMVVDLSLMGGTDTVMVIYGETMSDVLRDLEKMQGGKLPPVMPMPATKGEH
jgi:uncharacterized radical SAM superfamily protein